MVGGVADDYCANITPPIGIQAKLGGQQRGTYILGTRVELGTLLQEIFVTPIIHIYHDFTKIAKKINDAIEESCKKLSDSVIQILQNWEN